MDINRFINSKSIAKHLQAIGYKFTALEAAYLVWQSKLTTINDKLDAWERIIVEMHDMSVSKRRFGWETDEPSLHAFLRRYIDFVKSIVEKFYDSNGAMYAYDVLYKSTMDWSYNDGIYTSFQKCKAAIDKDMDEDVALYSVRKTELDGGESVKLLFNANSEAVELYANQYNDDGPWLLDYFEGLWLKFPTPFKKGDLVYQLSRETALGAQKKDPFVLTDMCTWGEKELRESGCTDEQKIARSERLVNIHSAGGDSSDMLVIGHWTNERGRMYTDHTLLGSYLDLEYYDGELDRSKKFLTALSNYENGEIGLELLLNTYMYFCNAESNEHIRKYTFGAYLDEQLKLVGLK